MNNKELWDIIRKEAMTIVANEPIMADLITRTILARSSFSEAIAYRLTRKLTNHAAAEDAILESFLDAFRNSDVLISLVVADIEAYFDRDPACLTYITPILYYKGFHAITCYRVAHHLWTKGRTDLALYFQSLISEVFAVDIHPAARIGGGLLLDHATGFVAGETTIIEDNVSILHEVTLGGTGKQCGIRHPRIESGVLIGAGAKILGRVTIGKCAKIGAGSVVLQDVEPHTTVVGVPAQVVSRDKTDTPASEMNQTEF